ncbi:unnamed protein product [Gordionus sp. m RMFG-2023]
MEAKEFTILSGNADSELTNLVCNRLGIKLGNCIVVQMPNKETVVDIGDSVRGRDVFILQTISKNVNNSLMDLLILTYACKTSSARQIIGVIPYLPYCKQSKMRKRGCIVSKLLAQMLCKAGMTHAITIDLHQKEIQGFFDIPIDNLRASPFLIHYIQTAVNTFELYC